MEMEGRYGYTGTRVHGYTGTRVHGYTGTRVHGYAGTGTNTGSGRWVSNAEVRGRERGAADAERIAREARDAATRKR